MSEPPCKPYCRGKGMVRVNIVIFASPLQKLLKTVFCGPNPSVYECAHCGRRFVVYDVKDGKHTGRKAEEIRS